MIKKRRNPRSYIKVTPEQQILLALADYLKHSNNKTVQAESIKFRKALKKIYDDEKLWSSMSEVQTTMIKLMEY